MRHIVINPMVDGTDDQNYYQALEFHFREGNKY